MLHFHLDQNLMYLNHYNDLDQTKKSVSDGKTLVANAITAKGVTTATDASSQTMADNIIEIIAGSNLIVSIATSLYMDGVGGDYKHSADFTTTLTVKKSDGTILLSKSITGNTGRVRDIYNGSCSDSGTYNITA